ncbi:MAG TPA: LytR C-terminal domain-containing protein [Clostridia bacterium]
MNRKLFLKLVFMITGSFIVIAMTIIVAVNFVNDSRLFQKSASSAPATKNEKSASAPQESTVESTDENKTYQYNRAPGMDIESDEHKNTPKPTDNKKQEKIKVQVINYSGTRGLAELVKSTLEASGYEVSAANESTNKPVRTMIIDLKNKKAGSDILKILKVGTVGSETSLASKFDVLVKIGDDFKP